MSRIANLLRHQEFLNKTTVVRSKDLDLQSSFNMHYDRALHECRRPRQRASFDLSVNNNMIAYLFVWTVANRS